MNQTHLNQYKQLWETYYKDCPLFSTWKKELENSQDITLLINGDKRSGKSTTALTIAEALDPAYQDPRTVNERFVFTARDFLAQVNSDLPEGSVICWEEIGVGSGLKSKNWYEAVNQIVIDTLQVYGHKAYFFIMTTPQRRFLDKDARVMVNNYIETSRYGLRKQYKNNRIMCQKVFNSSKYDKSYFYNWKVEGKKIRTWNINYPLTPGLVQAYEEHSLSRKISMEEKQEQQVLFLESKEKKEFLTPMFLFNHVKENQGKYIKKWGNHYLLNVKELASAFDIDYKSRLVSRARYLVNRDILPIYENRKT